MLVIRAGIYKMLSRIATGKTLIRLLQKQSDLGPHCCPGFYGAEYLLKSIFGNLDFVSFFSDEKKPRSYS